MQSATSVISALKGAKVLVLGAGVTGLAVEEALTKFGASVSFIEEKESREIKEKFISRSQVDSIDWAFAVVSPGWKLDHPIVLRLRERHIEIKSEIDLAWQIKSEIIPVKFGLE
ncbi:MAG: hypothetical protein WDO06_10050 [Actinomycetota bacterium]